MAQPDASPEQAPKGKKHRSPNFPAIAFMDALAHTRKVYDADKRNPASYDLLCKHMGFNGKNGSSIVAVSALKKYGLLVPGDGGFRVSDEAHAIFVHGESSPDAQPLIKALAMRPPIFSEVLKKYPDGLPSDQNLKARLQLDFNFSADAAVTMIKVLRHAVGLPGVDPGPAGADNGVVDTGPGSHAMNEGSPILSPQPRPAAAAAGVRSATERHAWKLGGDLWAEITITGKLDGKGLSKLRKYVELLPTDEEESEP